MSNRRDSVSICDPLTLSRLQSGSNWRTAWLLWTTKSLRGGGLCINRDPVALSSIYN